MSQVSVLKTKSFEFAVRIINMHKYLKKKFGDNVVFKQILKSGTAVGALIREAEFAESRQDFVHKLSIGLKEANESVYWLQLLFRNGYLTDKMFDSIFTDANEILKMLASSLKTLKNRK